MIKGKIKIHNLKEDWIDIIEPQEFESEEELKNFMAEAYTSDVFGYTSERGNVVTVPHSVIMNSILQFEHEAKNV